MRLSLISAAAAIALIGSPALAQSTTYSDEELTAYAEALTVIVPITQAAAGSPTPEQQAQMAQAVADAGLSVDQFNAIGTAAPGSNSCPCPHRPRAAFRRPSPTRRSISSPRRWWPYGPRSATRPP